MLVEVNKPFSSESRLTAFNEQKAVHEANSKISLIAAVSLTILASLARALAVGGAIFSLGTLPVLILAGASAASSLASLGLFRHSYKELKKIGQQEPLRKLSKSLSKISDSLKTELKLKDENLYLELNKAERPFSKIKSLISTNLTLSILTTAFAVFVFAAMIFHFGIIPLVIAGTVFIIAEIASKAMSFFIGNNLKTAVESKDPRAKIEFASRVINQDLAYLYNVFSYLRTRSDHLLQSDLEKKDTILIEALQKAVEDELKKYSLEEIEDLTNLLIGEFLLVSSDNTEVTALQNLIHAWQYAKKRKPHLKIENWNSKDHYLANMILFDAIEFISKLSVDNIRSGIKLIQKTQQSDSLEKFAEKLPTDFKEEIEEIASKSIGILSSAFYLFPEEANELYHLAMNEID